MKNKNLRFFLCLIGAGMLALCPPSEAQTRRAWGVGSFGGYSIPVFGMQERFSGAEQFGGLWHFAHSSRVIVEMEYHYSRFDDGKEADRMFTWAVDGRPYASPEAVSEIRFHSGVFNVLVSPHRGGFSRDRTSYYVAVGGGIYGYKSERRNFVYPGQKTAPLDMSQYLEPQVDEKAALGASVGFGGLRRLSESVALDLRARYHVVIGDLRPMSAWGYSQQTFPLQFFQVGAGLKFYFQKP